MKIIGDSHIGKVRKENQDAFWISAPLPEIAVGVVCDGMGGARGGSEASTLAVDIVRTYFQSVTRFDEPEALFREVLEQSNQRVFETAEEQPEFAGMGTTLVLALAVHDKVFLANVGDSRGYHISSRGVRQITKDHSAVQALVDSGHLTERQAKIHPNKNIITRAVGIAENVAFDTFETAVAPGDVIVLCSDGLTNFVDENEIQFETFGGNFEDLPKRLIDLANSRGGADNITVVAIQI